MYVYDFDQTIYKRDSTADFFFYSLRKHPKTFLAVPTIIGAFFKYYIMKKGTKTQFKEKLYTFLRYADVENEIEHFWDRNIKDIKKFYMEQHRDDDTVISASPEFIIKPACRRLGITNVMASVVDPKTGRHSGINCHGKEKVRRFKEAFPDTPIERFYSDSLSDTPLAELAKNAYMVKGDKITNWIVGENNGTNDY